MKPRFWIVSSALLLSSCQPAPQWEKEAEKAAESKSGKIEPPALDKITVEKRTDGLFYAKGGEKPFSGTDVEPLQAEPGGDKAGFMVVTPYRDGKIHGAKETFFPSGRLRESRVYDDGMPKEATGYFSNGKKKLFVKLNAKDVAEGEYKRWHENGQLHTSGAHDENERFHGEFKEYDDKGELRAHYLWQHGILKQAMFETPEQKEIRLKSYGKMEGEP